MLEIIPGILETEWNEIEKKLELIKPFASTVHIDIIDGKFVDNTTFLDPNPFKNYKNDFLLELHMMVEEPIDYIESWAGAGFQRFLGHVEKMSDLQAFIKKGKEYGEVGLAIDGPTQVDFSTLPMQDIDTLLIYTSERVGHSGPPFNTTRLSKVQEARKFFKGPIEVDGGITNETILEAKNVGATRFVSTSYLFKSSNLKEQFRALSNLL